MFHAFIIPIQSNFNLSPSLSIYLRAPILSPRAQLFHLSLCGANFSFCCILSLYPFPSLPRRERGVTSPKRFYDYGEREGERERHEFTAGERRDSIMRSAQLCLFSIRARTIKSPLVFFLALFRFLFPPSLSLGE